MENRKKALELYSKQISRNLADASDFVPDDIPFNKALDARDLAQDALANEVLKNTGVPIPAKNAKASQVEDFLSRIVAERYPEFKDPSVVVEDLSSYDNAKGIYVPSTKKMSVDNKVFKKDPINALGIGLHEAAHKFDDEVLNFKANDLKAVSKNKSFTPDEIYERMAKGHHAEIPNLREGSFGVGALKSYLKSGTFKGLAPVLGGGLGLAYSATSEAAGTEPVGESVESEFQMLAEDKAQKDYDKSQARKDAIKKLGSK